MCWVACDRLARIAAQLGLAERAAYWQTQAQSMHATISQRAWNKERGSFVSTFDGDAMDASLLLAEHINPISGEQWGNFVQTYSMVGLINAAIRLSIRWDQAF